MKKTKKAQTPNQEGIFNSALHNLSRVWKEIARLSVRSGKQEDTSPESLRRQIEACLSNHGGEVSARARAAELARSYLDFDEEVRLVFLQILARDFGLDKAKVGESFEVLDGSTSEEEIEENQRALRRALEPARVALLRKFNTLQSGPRFLVELRRELLDRKKAYPELRFLERDLKELLASWFDVGFLDLRSINWNAPASLLEKLGHYEAVHRVRSWHDLKNRLDADRRCYAFFHPCMPEEPLIFVEVALVNGLADQIQGLLDEDALVLDPNDADTAIFYSISNTQLGLAGISFGNFLIKQVVDRLRHEQPNLKQFATLSPIPGFKRWMDGAIKQGELELLPSEKKKLKVITSGDGSAQEVVKLLNSVRWAKDETLCDILKPALMRFCSLYLLKAKRGNGRQALDPVAHFHISNGASIQRLNWMADTSGKGLRESAGMMVNYLYRLDRIEKHHEDYSGNGKITASTALVGQTKK